LYWATTRTGEGGARVVEALLRHGASPELAQGPLFVTPLQEAARTGNVETVRLLLEAGARPNAGGRGAAPALSMAAIYGHVEVVQLLLAAGADPRALDDKGLTALQHAQSFGHGQIVGILSAVEPTP
jgi:ankyrin repeat protein